MFILQAFFEVCEELFQGFAIHGLWEWSISDLVKNQLADETHCLVKL